MEQGTGGFTSASAGGRLDRLLGQPVHQHCGSKTTRAPQADAAGADRGQSPNERRAAHCRSKGRHLGRGLRGLARLKASCTVRRAAPHRRCRCSPVSANEALVRAEKSARRTPPPPRSRTGGKDLSARAVVFHTAWFGALLGFKPER